MTSKKAVELLKEIVKYSQKSTGFEQVLKNVTGGDVGHCLAEFVVKKENLNAGGGLHGGFTATVVDNFTTYALVTTNSSPGVTVDLHVSYLKGAREGDTIIVDAKAVKTGKTLAYLECELRNKNTGQIIAKGSQTKFVASP
ncbi:acyl-coenzyme A thioesterase 13-like isoform X2 [Sitodiplosis mosellana]|uniref:acyl-coenzyme A thioesterase 13-like isoform X2 n=1 Tax=Sitodiplosis mosellana TaxID=263140 RepID=UPI0024449075|nr:acyl-coenzyme A thioesterase 13-like isoform X2 [Sitodiplosis mosellana]